MFRDYYKILEVSKTASAEEITKAYRRLAQKWHPDKNPGKNTTEKMALINEARLILKDPEKRARYDREYDRHYGAAAQARQPACATAASKESFRQRSQESSAQESDSRRRTSDQSYAHWSQDASRQSSSQQFRQTAGQEFHERSQDAWANDSDISDDILRDWIRKARDEARRQVDIGLDELIGSSKDALSAFAGNFIITLAIILLLTWIFS